MADFDPYYQWLAIPPKDQPPNHYRLLAVEVFEPNADVISNAADQRMAHVRSYQTGRYSGLSQKLLNEIAAAKVCLLNPERKAAYDRQLRASTAGPRSSVLAASAPVIAQRLGDLDFLKAPESAKAPESSTLPIASKAAPAKRKNNLPIWIGGGMVAAAGLVAIAVMIFAPGPRETDVASRDEPAPPAVAPLEKKPASPKPQDHPDQPAGVAEPEKGPLADPPQETVIPKPAADSKQPRNAKPKKADKPKEATDKPAKPPPTAVEPARPRPERDSKAVADEPTGPATEDIVAVAEKAVKGSPDRPKEKPPAARGATRPKENPPKPDASAAPKEKLAVPSEAARRQALTAIRDIYKDDYRAANKIPLAAKLYQSAAESKGDPAARYTMLQEAARMAGEAGQAEMALEAIDALAGEFQILASSMKSQLIDQLVKKARLPEEQQAVAEAALQVMDEAVAEENFEVARRVGRQAFQMARPTKDKDLIQEVTAKSNDVEAQAKDFSHVQEAMAALKLDPHDPAANLTVGKHLCFTKGDWTKGLPMLAAGSDPALKALAAGDLQGAATSDDQVKLGDAWWKVEKQRAIYWYAKAESGTDSALLKESLKKRIREGTQRTRWVRIFRSADPSVWNIDPDQGGVKVPENIKYLKMQINAKMAVIIEMTNDRLGKDETLPRDSTKNFGWMGSNKISSSARHLGIFAKTASVLVAGRTAISPTGQTGWGFGHRYASAGQACAWAGQVISPTIFEIDVTSDYLTAKEEQYLLK